MGAVYLGKYPVLLGTGPNLSSIPITGSNTSTSPVKENIYINKLLNLVNKYKEIEKKKRISSFCFWNSYQSQAALRYTFFWFLLSPPLFLTAPLSLFFLFELPFFIFILKLICFKLYLLFYGSPANVQDE